MVNILYPYDNKFFVINVGIFEYLDPAPPGSDVLLSNLLQDRQLIKKNEGLEYLANTQEAFVAENWAWRGPGRQSLYLGYSTLQQKRVNISLAALSEVDAESSMLYARMLWRIKSFGELGELTVTDRGVPEIMDTISHFLASYHTIYPHSGWKGRIVH